MTTMYLSDEFAEEIQTALVDLIGTAELDDGGEFSSMAGGVARIETFEEAMVLSGNKGLVIKFADGSEAQVTIVAGRPEGAGER